MTTVATLLDHDVVSVERIAPISLDALNTIAALQQRVDRKYVLEVDVLAEVLDELCDHGADLAVLDIDGRRSFRYESVYFDTPALESYLGAAHRRRRRFKVRTRTYVDSATTMLEVKTRAARGQTVKQRRIHDADEFDRLGTRGQQFVDEVIGRPGLGAALTPTLTTAYRRTTLVDRTDAARVTIDADVRCVDWTGAGVELGDRVILETKSAGAPSGFDRALWRRGARPEKISKFGTCLAALHPELPSNKWHRTLRRFGVRHQIEQPGADDRRLPTVDLVSDTKSDATLGA